MINWLKRQAIALSVAMGRVEENALRQSAEAGDMGVSQEQRHKKGFLSDALDRGEITQEVKELRWRMYKVIQATDSLSAEIEGYDEDGYPIIKMKERRKRPMKNITVDDADDYEPIMVVDNSEIMLSTDEATEVEAIKEVSSGTTVDEEGHETRTIAEVEYDEYNSNSKSERPINITRDGIKPKFEIERYAKRLIVRKINDTERLLEFYVSMYPDEYDRKTRLLISEIKKAIKNPRFSDMLEIKGVDYITDKTMGALDFHLYEYEVTEFDKIVEFDGNYVIKFKSIVRTDGLNIIEKYREADLDEKYERKEAK